MTEHKNRIVVALGLNACLVSEAASLTRAGGETRVFVSSDLIDVMLPSLIEFEKYLRK